MQHPVGYVINNGRAEMVDFGALVFNPKAWVMFEHTLTSGLTTAAFFVLGISAYHLVRKKDLDFFKRSFNLAAIVGTIAIVLVIIGGHEQGLWLLQNQPMKAAATEALYETEDPASFSLLTIGDLSGRREVWSYPHSQRVLSLLYYNRLSGEVPGINDLQTQYEAKYGAGRLHSPGCFHLLGLPLNGRGRVRHAGPGRLCPLPRHAQQGWAADPLAGYCSSLPWPCLTLPIPAAGS